MKTLLVTFLFLFVSINAQANCVGKVDRVQLTGAGAVELISTPLYGNTTGRRVCNLSTAWKGVTPEACRGWYALILASLAQDREIKMQYPAGETCATQPSWSDANPPHMMSNKEI